MSKLRKVFKPRIARIITGLIVAGLIVGGSYLAYRNGIFADTNASGCKINASITRSPNTFTVYAVDKANFDLAHQSGAIPSSKFQLADQGSRNYQDGSAVYFIGHKQDGTVVFDNTPLTCNQPKNVTVTANLVSGQISHQEQLIASASNNETSLCVEYPQESGAYSLFDYTGATYQRQNDPSIFIVSRDLANYNVDETRSHCSENNENTGAASTTSYCITNFDTAGAFKGTYTSPGNGNYSLSQKVSGNPPSSLSESDLTGNTSKQAGVCTSGSNDPSPGNNEQPSNNANENSTTQLKCIGEPGISDPTGKIWNWFGLNKNNKWQKVSGGQLTGNEYASLPGQEADPTMEPSPCGNKPNIRISERVENTEDLVCARSTMDTNNPDYSWIPRSLVGGADYVEEPDTSKCGPKPTATDDQSTIRAISEKGKLGNNPIAPTLGRNNQAQEYKNKINFTAYRESYAEPNHLVPMGGVKFTIRGRASKGRSGSLPTIPELRTATNSSGITSTDLAKCNYKDSLTIQLGRLLGGAFSKSFTTPDSGPTKNFTQTINVPPGVYEVTYTKNNFNNRGQRLCFQVGQSDGVETPVPINALLYAQQGAEAPGTTFSEVKGVMYDDSEGMQAYKTLISGQVYKYASECPYYGWQKDDKNFNCKEPVGFLPSGISVQNTVDNPYGYPNGSLARALSQCQNFSTVPLNGLSREQLAMAGALIGGLNATGGVSNVLGNTATGAAIGFAIGSLNLSNNLSINIGQVNQDCLQYLNPEIPPQCRFLLTTCRSVEGCGGYSGMVPKECLAYLPQIQAMLQMNNNIVRR